MTTDPLTSNTTAIADANATTYAEAADRIADALLGQRTPWRCTDCRQLHTDNGYPCQANHCPHCQGNH